MTKLSWDEKSFVLAAADYTKKKIIFIYTFQNHITECLMFN